VLGLEGDINYLKATRHQTFAFTPTGGSDEDTVATLGTRVRWLSTVRVSFGYAWERSLLYATGGLAIGRVESSTSVHVDADDNGPIFSGSSAATRTGWAAGGGYAYAFTDRLSGKLEYLHFDLGSARYNVVSLSADPPDFSNPAAAAKVSGDIFRVGLNWKFYP
jgi:outer membrane immunogenic protein